jgi:hypothetical protein
MRGAVGMGLRVGVLAAVAVAGGWLIWRNMPPFSEGVHSADRAGAANTPKAQAKLGPAPKIGSCDVFPADNVWNTPIDSLPKDPRSDRYIASIGEMEKLHPDFATSPLSGIPFSEVPPGTQPVPVSFGYADESDPGPYPIPPDAPIENGPDSRGDRHIILIDTQRCIDYELFSMEAKPDGSWEGGSGVKWDLKSDKLRPAGMGSADAAGLPIFPGLVRYDEVASGEIRHALRFTIPHTQAAYVWPGRHKASHITDTNVAPMGERFRLRGDYNISSFSKSDQVILTALKKYGMFLADNGGVMFLNGSPDKRWDDEDLHDLTRVRAEDFEAVDESRWESKDSAAVPAGR